MGASVLGVQLVCSRLLLEACGVFTLGYRIEGSLSALEPTPAELTCWPPALSCHVSLRASSRIAS